MSQKTRLEGLIKDLRQAIEQENYDRMKSLTSDIQQALMQIGSAEAGGATTNGSRATDGQGGEDVIDTDFVEQR